MENEIKINTIGQLLDYVETEEKANELIYYITNLQEENERLNKNNQAMQEEMFRTWQIADDYKSRNEKAKEYLDKVETLATLDGKIIFSINIFRNILKGE